MKKFFGLFAIFLLSATMFSGLASAADEDVVINEFNHYGSADWIELYNDGNTDVDLSDWTVQDGISTIKLLTGSIGAKGYAVFTWNKLNNLGDLIEIINGDGDTIDIVAYGNFDDGDMSDNAPAITINGNSVGRSPNGADTGTDNVDFVIFTTPTKGFSNGVIDDDEEPVLENVEVNPDSVNVDAGPATVTVTLEISDDSPIEWIDVNLESQDYDQQFWSNGVFEYNSVNDEYNVEMEIPQYSADGIWMVDRVWIADTFGNNKNFDEDDFGSVTFEVESSTPDLEAPVLDIDSIEFDPASANEGETVTLIFEASDAVSGIKLNDCHVCIRDAGFDYSDCEDVKAGADTGTYEAEFEVDTDEELTIYLHNIGLVDNVGNWISYDYFSFGTITFTANPSGNYGVSLSDPADQTVAVDENAIYTITITNTGDAEDTFDLTLSTTVEPLDTLKLSATSVDLEAGEDDEITLTVGSDTAGTYEVDVTATSQGDTSKTATVTITTTVQETTTGFIVSDIGTVTFEAGEDASTLEKTFTVDAGDSGVAAVYFEVTDLDLGWTNDADAIISKDNIKFYEGTREITSASLLQLSSKTVTMKIDIPEESDIEFYGDYAGTLNVKDAAGASQKTMNVQVKLNPRDYASMGDDLRIEWDDVPDDDTFYRGDEVTVVIIVDNRYGEDVEDVEVTLRNPELDLDEKSAKFDLDDGEEQEVTFTFEIPKDASSGNYDLYAFVEGEDSQDRDNDLFNYDVSDKDIEVNVESHHLVVNIDLDKDTVTAGDSITATVSVFNAGRDKEESLNLRVYSTRLGFDKIIRYDEIRTEKTKSEALVIPIVTSTADGVYTLNAELTYKDDDRQDGDDTENDLKTDAFITVGTGTGNGGTTPPAAKNYLSGTMSVAGTAGEPLKYVLTLKNLDTAVEQFEVKVSGHTDWADEVNVEPASAFSLGPGSSIPVFIYSTPESDAEGTYTALATVYVDGAVASTHTLTATISGREGGQLPAGVVTGGAIWDVDTSTVILAVSIIAALIVLGAIYIFTVGRR